MAITTPQHFIVISQCLHTEAMKLEIVQLLTQAGHHPCSSVFDKPLIFIILSLDDTMTMRKLDDGTDLTSKTWFRSLVSGAIYGGYAILYCDQLPSDQQALLKKDENFDADQVLNSAKEKLVLSFTSPSEILRCLEKIPEDLVVQNLDE